MCVIGARENNLHQCSLSWYIGSTLLFPSHLPLGSMGILPYDPNPQVILYDTWYFPSLSSFAEDEHIYNFYLFP